MTTSRSCRNPHFIYHKLCLRNNIRTRKIDCIYFYVHLVAQEKEITMVQFLRIAVWTANGLLQKINELKVFLSDQT